MSAPNPVPTENPQDTRGSRRVIVGRVTSSKMEKTIVVTVVRRVRDRRFHKFLTRRVKYHVHDENNAGKVGDLVHHEVREREPDPAGEVLDAERVRGAEPGVDAVGEGGTARPPGQAGQHAGLHVEGDDLPLGPHGRRHRQGEVPHPAADLEDAHARTQVGPDDAPRRLEQAPEREQVDVTQPPGTDVLGHAQRPPPAAGPGADRVSGIRATRYGGRRLSRPPWNDGWRWSWLATT